MRICPRLTSEGAAVSGSGRRFANASHASRSVAHRAGEPRLGPRGTQWGTSYSKRPLYAAKSETWTRSAIPTLAFPLTN